MVNFRTQSQGCMVWELIFSVAVLVRVPVPPFAQAKSQNSKVLSMIGSAVMAVTVIWEVSQIFFNTFCQLWLETKEDLVWFIVVIFHHHFPIWH